MSQQQVPDEIGVDEDWPTSFVQVPDWIILHPGLKAQAKIEYAFLAMHAPRSGRRIAFPGQESIARALQLSRGDQVAPYTRALEAAGAVRVEEITTPRGRAYRYVLRFNPPPGYTGPTSKSTFYGTPEPEADEQWSGWSAARAPARTPQPGGSPEKPGEGSPEKPGEGSPEKPGPKKTSRKKTSLKDGGSAVGRLPGGLAGAGASAGPGSKAASVVGGSAAGPKDSPAAKRDGRKPTRPARVSPARPVPGEDEVWAALAPVLAEVGVRAGTRPATLRRAVRLLLGHDSDARGGTPFGAFPRRVEHALARINAGWYAARGPERAGADYAGPDRIRRPVGYLAQVLTAQECPRPECEAGVLLTTGEECTTCQARAAERAATALAARLDAPEPLPDPEPGVPEPVDPAAVPAPRPTPAPAPNTTPEAARRPSERPGEAPPSPQSHHEPHGAQRGAYGRGWRAVMINPRTGGWDEPARPGAATTAGRLTSQDAASPGPRTNRGDAHA